MINNYTKNKLLPPPEKKKYTSEHVLLLTYIYYLKNFLSIGDIQKILEPVTERFFRQDEGLSFQDVYQEVVDLTMANIDVQARDIIRKMKKSNEAFADVEDPHDKDLLSKFTFICMLSFDIWVKKYIIENLVDDSLGEKK